jgi:voltage-gated sodium channel
MLREKVTNLVESKAFVSSIVALIILNAISLGMETSEDISAKYGHILTVFDKAILSIFVMELTLKLYAYRSKFFRSGWNVFDLLIVSASILPATGSLTILRSFRVLRVLRLFSLVPQMRFVITGLLRAIPGMASVVGVIAIIFYISSVLVTKVFGNAGNPVLDGLFGDLGKSMFTLFQLMTLEDWVGGIVEPAMELYPMAWLFFIPFIIITSFAVLNLFIGVIVEAMQNVHNEEQRNMAADDPEKEVTLEDLRSEIALLRKEIRNSQK